MSFRQSFRKEGSMKEHFGSEVASADSIESCASHKQKATKRDKRQTKEKTNDSVKTPRKSTVNTLTSKELGTLGENLACCFLERQDFEILDRNWKCSDGEVDIIASKDDETVFVEVKTRLQNKSGELFPETAVDKQKQARYIALARSYNTAYPMCANIRFDVIALAILDDSHAQLRHIQSAFEWDGLYE